ncbi:DUF2853 family protein [Flavobacterium laiguense]|uniref:DUF2853 domain-containing protein n=1 Tax=Flavobacterium laiguense TaxID=2169409 RepID=A0A2U1JK20_9FLAO|nr:DUF2853 family protein [Flavobacterium laiguense]PWA05501.1 DUF2853 domain-containing protein [Flavobacterium laiguense]
MSAKDELIVKYAADLKEKCGINPEMDLLKKITIGCGPSVFNPDSSIIAGTQKTEIDTVKKNFLIKKLGLPDGPALKEGIDMVLEQYGKSNRNKYRAVFYYLLTKHFGRESVYN